MLQQLSIQIAPAAIGLYSQASSQLVLHLDRCIVRMAKTNVRNQLRYKRNAKCSKY